MGTVTDGTEITGSGDGGSGSATGAVVEPLALGDSDSVTRGGAGDGPATAVGVDGASDVCDGTTPLGVRGPRACAWCRLGSGEACGSLCAEPETGSACG
ncbi:MAG TPA: hypothetical protein VIL96_10315 [Gaiellaceae bacterium]|jgi:hypothetical protein